ncbi:MAG: type II toxin-antitoxin system VapC family toxin [Proteobacteria bacterium]|nr:type II toxin-antitoxin system VapC family toxin [Pseudomonadota bacterium]
MVGLDTNVLVRLLISDDEAQTRRARKFVNEAVARDEMVLVSIPVLLETEWVLRSRYEIHRSQILRLFRSALETRELYFENESAVEQALVDWSRSGCGFADCLIMAHNRRLGCHSTATFDAKAARLPGSVAI